MTSAEGGPAPATTLVKDGQASSAEDGSAPVVALEKDGQAASAEDGSAPTAVPAKEGLGDTEVAPARAEGGSAPALAKEVLATSDIALTNPVAQRRAAGNTRMRLNESNSPR